MAEKTTTILEIPEKAGAAIILSDELLNKILERFEKDETVLGRSGQRITDSFRRLLRRQMGLKEDYTTMTREEKIAEAKDRIREDFDVARQEIKRQNPVDYLLDRALDPLDPMNVVYRIILQSMGAEFNEQKKSIRLTPQLRKMLLKSPEYPKLTGTRGYNHEQF